ncbi:MAG: DegT/DnrJ/EryC1/StrS family aminotransferase [Candidatus Babeliales bacterium]
MHALTIPFFSLERQIKKIEPLIMQAMQEVIQSQQFIGGPFVDAFEKKCAAYVNVNHVIACNSGTDALWIALKALGVEQDTIVLTTAFSFIASSSEIAAHRAHPVFIDVDPITYTIDVEKIEIWLAQHAVLKDGHAVHRTTGFVIKGIVAVDLFGHSADYDKLGKLAKEWGLWVLADCAQSIGTEFKGKKTAALATVSIFSFYPTKNLGAFGDGGCCMTNDPVLAERILQLRNHGRKSHYDYLELGINSRLDALQAAILSVKLDFVDDYNQRRRDIAARYNQKLSNLPFLKLPQEIFGKHTYHQYMVQVVDVSGCVTREKVEQSLAAAGIQTRVFYPKALTEIPFLSNHQALVNACPIAQRLTQTILALPVWPELEDSEIDYVCDALNSISMMTVAAHDTKSGSCHV